MTTEIDPNRWYWVLVETRNLPWAATSSATYEHEFSFKGRLLSRHEKELLFQTEGGVLYYFQDSSITVGAVNNLLFIVGGCAIRGNTPEQLAAELKEEGLESALLATLLEEEGEPA
jgi:hypothetical protein